MLIRCLDHPAWTRVAWRAGKRKKCPVSEWRSGWLKLLQAPNAGGGLSKGAHGHSATIAVDNAIALDFENSTLWNL